MSSRYPNSSNRERSPPPRFDRRPSGTYSSLGSSYRGAADPGPSSDRAPPRGPKADFRGTSFQFSPATRGRGGFPRSGDTWDRDRDRDRDRETRPAPQSYRARDDDRPDWQRRDRDFGTADRGGAAARDSRPYAASRDRSASPIRARRDSRESIPSTYGRQPDNASSYYAPASRGALSRGRGRGDWDRSRGRNSFVGERDRDLFHNRSRSRESWRDRDFDRGRQLPSDPDRPDRYERRDYDRSSRERDIRGQDGRQRDHSPARSTGGHALGPVTTPSVIPGDRPGKPDHESARKSSVIATPTSSSRDPRRDTDQSDYFGISRADPLRRDQPQATPQPASAVGLDYGPPPSVTPVTTPAFEKPPASKPAPPKIEPISGASSTFQPPSGPKSIRTPSTPNAPQGPKASQANDTWPRSEPYSRPIRTSVAPATSNVPAEMITKKEDPPTEPRAAQPPTLDRAMPPNVPSGPRLGASASTFKQRISSVEPLGTTPSPTAPREPSKPPIVDTKPPTIPTGPRSDREATHRDGARPMPGTGSKIWVSPDYKPKPSIMNQLNKPYQPEPRERTAFIPTGPRQGSSFHGLADKGRALPSAATSAPTAPSGPKALTAGSPRIPDAKITLIPRQPIEEVQTPDDIEMSMPATSEEEDEVEDDPFDEEYFAESEERFKQEVGLLEGRKPPPVLQDGTIVALLIKLQFLEMLLQDSIPKPAVAPVEDSKQDLVATPVISTRLPSPAQTSNGASTKSEPEDVYPTGRPLKQAPVNPIPTPPIEDLPYLNGICHDRVIFDESDNEVEHEAVNMLLQQEFERNAWDWCSEMEDIHAEFKRRFPLWKHEIAHIEHERRELQASPAPASPAPSAAPSVTPSLTHERTRGARNTTEADLQAAILMSQQSAKEEEERREREAASSSVPNYDTEAVIPAMMKPMEIESCHFEDTNRLIADELIVDIYAYLPPVDDFTDEEQSLFITAYCQTPKKWGKIAESIPGRTYHDCIAHYYLTKNKAHYKDIWRRSQPKRRRGRAATKPRSTALMSELVYGDDGEAGPVPVTDSGRPRRAAAPTFGDPVSENDPSTPVPPSRKLNATPKDGSAEPTPKATRGRKAGIATKTRRTKAQIQADQQALLNAAESPPVKTANGTKTERGRTLLRAENVPIRSEQPAVPQAPRPLDAGLPQYPLPDVTTEPVVPHNPVVPSQVTSYWSVPEQNKFPQLLGYFGRDFAAIAEFMKTKSMTMVRTLSIIDSEAFG